jgi:hypothetical protein
MNSVEYLINLGKAGLAWIAIVLLVVYACFFNYGWAQTLQMSTSLDGRPYLNLNGPVIVAYDAKAETTEYGFATIVKRTKGNFGTSSTVAGQFNAWSGAGVAAQTWGVATEAVATTGSQSILIGTETLIGNLEPTNTKIKVANNAVFTNKIWGYPSPYTKNNDNTIAYWVTAAEGTGFETALKVERGAISDSNIKTAAVVDISELEDDNVVVFRLSGGRVVTVADLKRIAR